MKQQLARLPHWPYFRMFTLTPFKEIKPKKKKEKSKQSFSSLGSENTDLQLKLTDLLRVYFTDNWSTMSLNIAKYGTQSWKNILCVQEYVCRVVRSVFKITCPSCVLLYLCKNIPVLKWSLKQLAFNPQIYMSGVFLYKDFMWLFISAHWL